MDSCSSAYVSAVIDLNTDLLLVSVSMPAGLGGCMLDRVVLQSYFSELAAAKQDVVLRRVTHKDVVLGTRCSVFCCPDGLDIIVYISRYTETSDKLRVLPELVQQAYK